jgi:radical SAM superfamily enzyme YgiQ (UPF0313 family)
MKRLLLILPLSRHTLMGGGFFFRMPSLSLLRIAAFTPSDWEVKIVDEKVESLDRAEEADLVGISVMTSTARRAYEIADGFRLRGVKVVTGGMHASVLPEEALQHSDCVVIGEAEGLWPILLRDFESGVLQPIYAHKHGLPELGQLPRSDWELYQDKGYLPVHFVETTRGCPIDCEFCSVTSSFGGKYRNRPQEDVLEELQALRPFQGFFVLKNCVFFVDDNIFSNRGYAREFLTRIKGMGLHWFGQASMNIGKDPEMLKLCRESGCMGLFLGFETLSPDTLAAVGKKVNRPAEYLDIVKRIHDHGIGIDGSFVFGFDQDDPSVFDRTIDFVLRAKLEVAYFSILTPYPGTRLYTRMETSGRLLTRDWSLYDGHNVVYRPEGLTADQLLDGYRRVFREVYSFPSILRRLWGTTAWKAFFYPMNFGFRQSTRNLRWGASPRFRAVPEEEALLSRTPNSN